jgi:hypothetical protein
MTDATEIAELQKAILKLHGSDAIHVESVPVLETFQGETVWDGAVEVFVLPNHPAGRAYAWSHEGDSGGRRYVAVLHAPPVDSPRKAVQAAAVAEFRERQRNGQ